MNAKQRRRFVRQYKEKINTDRVLRILEGSFPTWFDSVDENNLCRYKYDGEPVVETVARLNYYYALHMKEQEKHNERI
jgi:hypothetical protein